MSDPNEIPLDDISGVEERPQNRRQWSGALRSLVLPVLVVATIVGALVYVERLRGGGGGANADGLGIVALPEGMNPTGRSPSTDEGRAAPDFVLETPDGARLRFSDFRGKPLLVNFWATWCKPCREEMPLIVDTAAARAGDGLVVITVDLQENPGQVREFAADFGMTFPIVIDRTGQVADAWRIGGPIQGIPSSYFIDREGIVRARAFGPMKREVLEEKLRTVLE